MSDAGQLTTWRSIAAPIIAETIRRVGREEERALRQALRDAYPFGERAYHPYKIWCDEVQRQLRYGADGADGAEKTNDLFMWDGGRDE